MEKPSSSSYNQAAVKIGFTLSMYFFEKARNLSCWQACFTRQMDIDHGNGDG